MQCSRGRSGRSCNRRSGRSRNRRSGRRSDRAGCRHGGILRRFARREDIDVQCKNQESQVFTDARPAHRCPICPSKTTAIDVQLAGHGGKDRKCEEAKENGCDERTPPDHVSRQQKNTAEKLQPRNQQRKDVHRRKGKKAIRIDRDRERFGGCDFLDAGQNKNHAEDQPRERDHESMFKLFFHGPQNRPGDVESTAIFPFTQPSNPSSYR